MNGTLPHPRPSRLRRRLWKAGGLVLILLFTATTMNAFVSADRAVTRQMLGHDFLPFYAAGTMARTGQYHLLYDAAALKRQESSLGFPAEFGPWWNPPFAAWLFAPLTLLSFPTALATWELIGAAMLIAAIVLLIRLLPRPADWRTWGLIPLLILASNPLLAVATHAQNTFLTLLLLSITVTLWRAQRALAAGIVAGLLLYKPQHAMMVALALFLTQGRRAAAGFALTAALLILITLFTMPGALTDYAHQLPRLIALIQDQAPYAWDRHVTLKAFWRLLLQGIAAGPTRPLTALLWTLSELLVIAALAPLALAARRDRALSDRFMAAAIAAGPLLVPFCLDYDLLILAVPAVLYAAGASRNGPDRRTTAAWAILFLTLHVSTPLARPLRLNLATIALAALVVSLSRPRRPAAIAIRPTEPALVKLAA